MTSTSNNQMAQSRPGVAIIQCSGDSSTTRTDQLTSRMSTLNTNSTLGSVTSSNLPGKKRRLFHRFKRRAPAKDLWNSGNGGGTVVKVGSESGSIRSSRGTSTSGTWRMQLSSLSSQPCSTFSSTKSGRTLRYEDLEAAYAAANAQFRSVVDVESTCSTPDPFKSVVTVEGFDSAPVPHEINVIVENAVEQEDVGECPVAEVSQISVDSLSDMSSLKLDGSPRREGPVSSSNQSNEHTPTELRRDPRGDNRVPPVIFAGPQFLPSHLGPLPPIFVGARGPWSPPFNEAATPPIELTRWRLNHSFDPNPLESDGETGRSHRPHRNEERDLAGNMLHPEDLPRIFPGHLVPPPFARFDEDFADEDELKGCCGNFSRVSHSTLIRWFIGIISMVGMACVVVGIVLGALTVSGTTRLTLCLLMIGVGAVLITVSGVAWRLTAINLSSRTSCWNIFGIRRHETGNSLYGHGASRNPYLRVRSPMGRSMHPFAGFLYPEFAWRPPPPSYQASVREAQLQQFFDVPPVSRLPAPSGSPPPTYRPESREPRSSLEGFLTDMSRPPSYRSHESIPGIIVDERPFSRQDHGHNDFSHGVRDPPGAVAVPSEPILVDDRQRLLLAHGNTLGRENRDHSNPMGISINGEFVSVIDCSTAVPVGFQVSENENQSTDESAGPNTDLTPRKRPRNRGFHFRGAIPPPSSGNPTHGFFLVGGLPARQLDFSRYQRRMDNAELEGGPSYV